MNVPDRDPIPQKNQLPTPSSLREILILAKPAILDGFFTQE